MGICPLLPLLGYPPPVLEERGTHIPHQLGDPGQLGQSEAVEEANDVVQDLKGQAAEGVQILGTLPSRIVALRGLRKKSREMWSEVKRAQVLVIRDRGPVGGGAEPLLAVGAAQVSQGAALLKPAAQTGLDVGMRVPEVGGELVPPEEVATEEGEGRAGFVVPLLALLERYLRSV